MDRLLAGVAGLESARARLDELVPSHSTTTLYVETDAPPAALRVPATECMLIAEGFRRAAEARRCSRESRADAVAAEEAYWRLSTAQVTDYHRLDPTGGCVLCLNVLDRIDHWPARRTPEYRQKKQRAREVLLDRLFAAFPSLRGRVSRAEVASPHTYQRYTYNHRGAGYGAIARASAPGPVGARRPFHADFPIPNVKFLSAWVAGPTYEAAIGYGELEARSYRPG
jgi:phytoene dehydrogenase-like protein